MGDGTKGPGMSLQTHWCQGGPATPSCAELYPSMGTPSLCAPTAGTTAQTPFLSPKCRPNTQPPLPFAGTVWQVRCHGQATLPLNAPGFLVSLLCPPHVVLHVISLNFPLLPCFCSSL